jgi:hypothetical protein
MLSITHPGARLTYRSEHDSERGLVSEVLSSPDTLAWVLGKKLQVSSTTFQTLLHLDFVLNHQGLSLGENIDGLMEYSGNGVMSGLGLFSGKIGSASTQSIPRKDTLTHDQTLISLDPLGNLWLLNAPLADIAHSLVADRSLLHSLRNSPSRGPVRGELLQEGGLDGSRLRRKTLFQNAQKPALLVGQYTLNTALSALTPAALKAASAVPAATTFPRIFLVV